MPKDSPEIAREKPAVAPPAGRDEAGTTPKRASAAARPAAAPGRRRKRWRRILLVLGPLVVLAGAGYVYFTGGRYVGTENSYVKADTVMVGADVSGPITQVAVHENQHVQKGDVLFRIDDRPYKIALQAAEAHLASVHDEIAGLKDTYRQKQASLDLAKANVAYAQKQYHRYARMAATSAVSQSAFDAASHDLDVAKQNVRVTEQELAQIRTQLAGNPDIRIDQHPKYLEAKAARDKAALDLQRTVVRAPFAGVATNTPEPGQQVVGNGALSAPVMSIVADKGVWIDANYKETELTHVKPGQPVTISIDTYPGHTWHGSVQSISPATGAEFSVIPPQNATGNWVKVVQRIPVRIAVKTGPGDPELRAGMSAVVSIDTGHRRALPSFIRTALAAIGLAPSAKAAGTGPAQ